jgi:hypothetical protein
MEDDGQLEDRCATKKISTHEADGLDQLHLPVTRKQDHICRTKTELRAHIVTSLHPQSTKNMSSMLR